MKTRLAFALLISILAACTAKASGSTTDFEKSIATSIPNGYVLSERIQGDLNGDKIKDNVLIIKGTDKTSIIKNEAGETLDKNRRGIIIALSSNGGHQVVLTKAECFSSENEDGGGYFAPELFVEIKNGVLKINYLHGRYGAWSYTFRFQNSSFELIGFDSSENRGPVILRTTSINLSTNKVQTKVNMNPDSESGEEKFKSTLNRFQPIKAVKLSEIDDFDNLDVASQIRPIK